MRKAAAGKPSVFAGGCFGRLEESVHLGVNQKALGAASKLSAPNPCFAFITWYSFHSLRSGESRNVHIFASAHCHNKKGQMPTEIIFSGQQTSANILSITQRSMSTVLGFQWFCSSD